MMYINLAISISFPLLEVDERISFATVVILNAWHPVLQTRILVKYWNEYKQTKGIYYFPYMCFLMIYKIYRDLDLVLDMSFFIILYKLFYKEYDEKEQEALEKGENYE